MANWSEQSDSWSWDGWHGGWSVSKDDTRDDWQDGWGESKPEDDGWTGWTEEEQQEWEAIWHEDAYARLEYFRANASPSTC